MYIGFHECSRHIAQEYFTYMYTHVPYEAVCVDALVPLEFKYCGPYTLYVHVHYRMFLRLTSCTSFLSVSVSVYLSIDVYSEYSVL